MFHIYIYIYIIQVHNQTQLLYKTLVYTINTFNIPIKDHLDKDVRWYFNLSKNSFVKR